MTQKDKKVFSKKRKATLALSALTIAAITGISAAIYLNSREQKCPCKDCGKFQKHNHDTLKYIYEDKHDPSTTYAIKLNYQTGDLKIKVHTLSDADPTETHEEVHKYIASVPTEKLEKIKAIAEKRNCDLEFLTAALLAIAENTANETYEEELLTTLLSNNEDEEVKIEG